MAKNIMFIGAGSKEWIGGLYYVKNIIYTMMESGKFKGNTNIYILTEKDNESLFKNYTKYNNIKLIIINDNMINRFIKNVTNKFFHRQLDVQLLINTFKYKIDYLYPVYNYPYIGVKEKCVYWIPDFQHIHLPEMFSQEELKNRNRLYEYIAKKHKKLILSSFDSYNDYKQLYPQYTDNINVIQFSSDINEEKAVLNDEFINKVIDKYNIPNEYIFLPNQFWKHKNHITAFKAINILVNKKRKSICLVCTGNLNDYRNKTNYNYLIEYIKQNELDKNIKILGYIPRTEQLALMKGSKFVIQPSLFEGWGTVVEDAKQLDKTIVISDIKVHFEQKNHKCIVFKKDDQVQLSEIIEKLI
jgi:glycosyltransferase involved in cell wall biosynthesis